MLTDMLTGWSNTAFVLVAMSTGMFFNLYRIHSHGLYRMNNLSFHKSNIETLR